jgi:hypothetical protein
MSGREIRLVITGKSKHTAGELVSFEEISVIQGTDPTLACQSALYITFIHLLFSYQ